MIPRWETYHFDTITAPLLHKIYAARQAVFAVEQQICYQDADDYDPIAHHLCGWDDETLLAYLRILPPHSKYQGHASLGRVLTTAAARGHGMGKGLLAQAIAETVRLYPATPIRISGQHYLERFYQGFGFQTISDIYSEDGIPHVAMVRPA